MCHCGCRVNSQVGYHFICVTPCVLEQGVAFTVPLDKYGSVVNGGLTCADSKMDLLVS